MTYPGACFGVANNQVQAVDPEGLKEVYGATRDKVLWWPLK